VICMPPPYTSIQELPESVQKALPVHGQEIFLKAVNNAWEQYKEPKERRNPKETREEVAFKVAWAAVEQVYEKDPKTSTWRRKT
jgi:cation transport regulator